MRLPNGYGSVIKLSGKRRNPYLVRKTAGWHYDKEKDKQVQDYLVIGYAPTKAEGLQMLAEYNKNPFDITASKITFQEVYQKWSESKFPTISDSNAKGYTASYKLCGALYNKVFKDIRLTDLQYVVDNCGKNYPTLRKLKVLFSQLYAYAMKNDICGKDYSEYVDIVKFKDRNPNKMDRNKFSREEVERLWEQKNDKYYQIVLMLIYTGVRISELLDLKNPTFILRSSILMWFRVKQRMAFAECLLPIKCCRSSLRGLTILTANIYCIPKTANNSNTVIITTAISLR